MRFTKKLVVTALLTFALTVSSITVTTNEAGAVPASDTPLDCTFTGNSFWIPDFSPTSKENVDVNLSQTGKIWFSAHSVKNGDDVDFPTGRLCGSVSFSTNLTDTLYHYVYTNNTPVDMYFALYDSTGKEIDSAYTKQTLIPGATYDDVVSLEKGKKYYFTVYTDNKKEVGAKTDRAIAQITVSPCTDDVGDRIDDAKQIETAKLYTNVIQGRPDVDFFKVNSPGTALAITVQNKSTDKGSDLTVRVSDKNGDTKATFTVDSGSGKAVTQEVFKLQMNQDQYITIGAESAKHDVEYTLQADPVQRIIEYVLGSDDAKNGDNPAFWNVGVAFPFKPATRPGYIFGGWFTSQSCSEGSEIDGIKEDDANDMTVYAKWTRFSVALPTELTYTKSKKSIKIEFVKAENATYTKFTCNGKSYKVKGTKVTLKKLSRNKKYKVKIQSFWVEPGVGTTKSKIKTVYVRTSK